MNPIIQNQNTRDASMSPIQPKKFFDVVTPPSNLDYRGTGMFPTARTIQSPNYKKGTTGWIINSNGTSEFN